MIKGKTIICFASGYDAPPTSKHHIMHMLSEDNRVLWINYHASRVPTASSSDLLYIFKKLYQVVKGISSPRKHFYVLTPLVIPLPGSKLVRRINKLLLINQIRMALRKMKKGAIQVWSFTPDIAYILDYFSAEKIVYYCVDDHAAFSGYDTDQVLRDERELAGRSDLVITTSMALQKSKAKWNINTVLVPHGVDFEHFNRAVNEHFPRPCELDAIPHPRLGFFGLLRDWVDIDLLAEVAKKRPEWHFVMIGDADSSVDLDKYRTMANMHFLGRKPYAQLPAFCQHFDIGLIPFKVNTLTHAVNPIKLREYLAAGLPVISTPMPEVQLYSDFITIVQNSSQFERAVKDCLKTSESDRKRRVEAMKKETWPQKMDHIYNVLKDLD